MSPSHDQPWTKLYPPSVQQMHSTPDVTLGDMLAESRARYSDRTAMTFEGRTWTFEELHQQAHAFAKLLIQNGLRPGDRVAIVLPNRPEYVTAIFGVTLAQGIVVQINNRYPAEEIRRILDDSGADLVIATDETVSRCSPEEPGFLGRRLIRVDTVQGGDDHPGTAFSDLEQFLGTGPLQSAAEPADVAVLQYTGGTTGAAKGVMLTHRNLIANVEQRYAVTYGLLDVPVGAKTVNVLPMCHVFALTAVTLLAVRSGMNQLLIQDFRPAQMLATIRDEKPYVFSGVPTMYTALNRDPGVNTSGLDQVAIFNSAGAGFPLEQIKQFEHNSGGRIIEGFGISEASPSTHLNPLYADRKVGSIGIPLPLTEVRVINQSGDGVHELPVGEIGEMIVRGPQIMKGYWNRPEQTAETLRDGWLLTGDLARMDEDGYFFIVGRKKEMIVTSGFNVYPAEVEQILAKFPGMLETAVVGRDDEYRGEKIVAFITLEPGLTVTDEELDAHCRQHLAGYKIPREYARLSALPRTAVGKIAKNQLPLGTIASAGGK
ncbi:long-chain fatty acid--CoA ligase (plasmid) [Paenarthrobacter sp. OM7]|uniref:long-chain-fatty-acid--CoA ligase n=1 Tax=Paenarthrobacter sp. OM7 TaxID=3041264 RepID=UPI002468FC81|nr:long-chain fatty acid--CoA ligase [Paenarthrobacter sp. OM7]WGM22926.1 long-chain fatty acid--CoA ligase [Paenarthrobacter sp. OM7]